MEGKMKRGVRCVVSWLVVAAVMAMFTPVSMSFAALSNDDVISAKLKEADGTSGQNTNSGSGVKTGHIQNGAVTNEKISGLISVDKLATYSGVKIVHTGPADGVNTFNDVNDAINSITTPDQPTFIRVMPGYYGAIDASKAKITIEGSGIENTFIEGAVNRTSQTATATFRNLTLGNSWVCLDSISNTIFENVYCNGAMASRPGSVLKLKDTYVKEGGVHSEGQAEIINTIVNGPLNLFDTSSVKGSTINGAIALQGNGSSNTITDTTVNQGNGGYGIGLFGNVNVKISNTKVYGGQYAVQVGGSPVVDITNSHLGGTEAGLASSGATVNIANSNFPGIVYLSGTGVTVLKVVNCYDSGFNPVPNQ